ncbi:MAG: low molecular weight phosphotyrosine protein phosphatase [Flavobacteriales bacterium]|nr:low molecular weight phosphotyrosine protein phosphatase [Flavobacteriales bacterium]
MVCLGNICRSPIAHGLLETKAQSKGVHLKVDSCGTGGWHAGELPDGRSVEVMNRKGYDITNQRSRKIRISDFEDFDLILCMDRSNYKDVSTLAPIGSSAKIEMILNGTYSDEVADVPDPYYGGPDGFDHVYNMLDKATDGVLETIISN